MALPRWPEDIDAIPLLSGYKETIRPQIEATDFEGGNRRQRPKRSIPSEERTCTWLLPQKHKEIFHEWWKDELGNGAYRFKCPILDYKGDVNWYEVMLKDGVVDYAHSEAWEQKRANVPEEIIWLASATMFIYNPVLRDEDEDDE